MDRFHFVVGDITINKEWVEYHVKKCDVVVPLVQWQVPRRMPESPMNTAGQRYPARELQHRSSDPTERSSSELIRGISV
jgi:hypothetical protein